MWRGIAQIAAQAGSQVLLFDVQDDTAQAAQAAVFAQWDRLCEKGRLEAGQTAAYKSGLHCAPTLASLAGCDLIVEAVLERLDVKATLFAELEAMVGPSTVLVTNTSSLSVTTIAAQLKRPAQFAGFHFFNPVP